MAHSRHTARDGGASREPWQAASHRAGKLYVQRRAAAAVFAEWGRPDGSNRDPAEQSGSVIERTRQSHTRAGG